MNKTELLPTGRNIFAHPTLEQFLADHIESERMNSKNWTVHAWAKLLQLPNAASITRVLTGERIITNRMSKALQEYFRFTELETRYFLFLVLKNKSKTDSLLGEVLQEGCWPVPQLEGLYKGQKPLLEITNGRILTLSGEANLFRTNQLLVEDGLECVPVNNSAIVTLSVAEYQGSTVGPYSEFYFSIICRPQNATLSDIGVSYRGIICNSTIIVNLGTIVWGNDYRVGEISLNGGRANVMVKNQSVLDMKLDAPHRRSKELPESTEFWGFAAVHGSRRRYRMYISCQGRGLSYQESDSFLCPAGTPLANILDQIDFSPRHWEVREKLNCQVMPTMSI